MSLSRSIHLFKQLNNVANKKPIASLMKQQVRHSGDDIWCYRSNGVKYEKKFMLYFAEGYMALAWWWVLWHWYHEYDWVTGEWDVPNTRDWTDAELGIPPDDD